LVSASASADLVPNGFKSVRLSIQVDAQVPEGRTLVLANTFRGADVLTTGGVEQVEWHPMGGEMRVVSLSAEAAKEIAKLSGPGADRDAMKQLLAKGQDCSKPFAGVRTLPDSNPADEVRWRFRISFKGDSCQTDEFATQYLSKDGKVVGTGADDTKKPTTPAAPAAVAPGAASKPEAPQAPAPQVQPTKSGCGSCSVGAPQLGDQWSALAMFAFGLALSRRRRA
jgi:MYXO-CTERM domain-containing protein